MVAPLVGLRWTVGLTIQSMDGQSTQMKLKRMNMETNNLSKTIKGMIEPCKQLKRRVVQTVKVRAKVKKKTGIKDRLVMRSKEWNETRDDTKTGASAMVAPTNKATLTKQVKVTDDARGSIIMHDHSRHAGQQPACSWFRMVVLSHVCEGSSWESVWSLRCAVAPALGVVVCSVQMSGLA